MPIYEYECQSCGKVFEKIQRFSDPVLNECVCEERAPVTKLISAAAFHLKGGGWYVTDFRDKAGAKDKKKDGGEPDAGTKTDKKEAKAGEPKAKDAEGSVSKPSAAAD